MENGLTVQPIAVTDAGAIDAHQEAIDRIGISNAKMVNRANLFQCHWCAL